MPSILLPNSSPLRPVLVVSLDGLPHSLLTRRATRPGSPWAELLPTGGLQRIQSSRPEMSSVAWASYLTGENPGGHGVFGFVEAEFTPRPRLRYPNRLSLRPPSLLQRVHDAGGHVLSINVPMTGPPAPLRGVTVGGFLGGELAGNVHPPPFAAPLAADGYVVDTDPGRAYESRDAYLADLNAALDARLRLARRLLTEQPWDYAHLHLMETDRLFHFYWNEPAWAGAFDALLLRCEQAALEFVRLAADRGAVFVSLSDHGFTRSRRVVFVNTLLEKLGLLRFHPGAAPSFETIDRDRSRAFALAPGRMFLLRSDPGLLADLAGTVGQLKDPETGEPVIERVARREELYAGPFVDQAAPLQLLPREGVDLKADFGRERVFETPSVLVGTHTFEDAYWFSTADGENVVDIAGAGREVRRLLGVI